MTTQIQLRRCGTKKLEQKKRIKEEQTIKMNQNLAARHSDYIDNNWK